MRRAAGSSLSKCTQEMMFSWISSILGVVEEGSPPPTFHLWYHAVVEGGKESWKLSDGSVALDYKSAQYHVTFDDMFTTVTASSAIDKIDV
eukprot:9793310-Ditylum_brightwellii.AAC.1